MMLHQQLSVVRAYYDTAGSAGSLLSPAAPDSQCLVLIKVRLS